MRQNHLSVCTVFVSYMWNERATIRRDTRAYPIYNVQTWYNITAPSEYEKTHSHSFGTHCRCVVLVHRGVVLHAEKLYRRNKLRPDFRKCSCGREQRRVPLRYDIGYRYHTDARERR